MSNGPPEPDPSVSRLMLTEDFSRYLNSIAFFLNPGGHCRILSTDPYFLSINDEVGQALRRAAQLSPQESSIHHRLARVLIHQQGRLDEAIAEFRRTISLQPLDGDLHLELAAHLFLHGRLDEAIPEIREAIRIDPKDDNLKFFLGTALEKKGDLHAAFETFRQIYLLSTARESDSTSDLIIAGFMHATASPEELIAVYRERTRSGPQDAVAISRLGDLLQSQKRFDEASAVYREAIRLHPNDLKLHGLLARTLKRQGKEDQANAEFAKQIGIHHDAIKRSPKDISAHLSLARALLDHGMWDEALKELSEAFRVAPFSNPYSSSAIDLHSDGSVFQAIALCREGVRVKPADSDAHNVLGLYLLDLGDVNTALAEIREARRIEPKNPNYLDNLGSVHFARGELKEALGFFREASDLLNEHPYFDIAARLRRVERLLALEPRLDTILRGQEVVAGPQSKLDVAELSRVTRRFDTAVRFYREAFQTSPELADDYRLRAAIAAAQAGTIENPAKDDAPLDETARARWRAQALEWLRAETSVLRQAPGSRPAGATLPRPQDTRNPDPPPRLGFCART